MRALDQELWTMFERLKGVNFRVRAGEVVALLGPNGAGKTTAVKLLLGLLQPNTGKVRVLGGDPTNPGETDGTGRSAAGGRVPETLRVREHIDLFSSTTQNPLPTAAVLAAAGLMENFSERKFGDLSEASGNECCLPSRSAGIPIFFFWTSRPPVSMWKRGACCGNRSGNWSDAGKQSC